MMKSFVARRGFACAVAALTFGVAASAAQAAAFTSTYTGTLVDFSYDETNVFGYGPDTNLTGKTATFAFTGDTSLANPGAINNGSTNDGAGYSSSYYQIQDFNNPGVLSGTVTINGVTQSFGSSQNFVNRFTESFDYGATNNNKIQYYSRSDETNLSGNIFHSKESYINQVSTNVSSEPLNIDLTSSLIFNGSNALSFYIYSYDYDYGIGQTINRVYAYGILGTSTLTYVGTTAVPGPIAGAGLPALAALGGFAFWRRRRPALAA